MKILAVKSLIALVLLTPAWAKPSAPDLCKQGEALFDKQKVAESLEKYAEAIKLDPKCAKAYAARGMIFGVGAEEMLRHGNAPGATKALSIAIEALSKAVQYDPKDAVSWLNRGNCYYRQGLFAKALSDYDQSLKLAPNPQAFISRAACHSKLGKDEKAIADYSQAYAKGHGVDSLFNRGNCYLRLGQRDKALADYELVAKKGTDPRVVAGAKSNIEALKEGSAMKPATAPNKPR